MTDRQKGVIKTFFNGKGYGFIEFEDASKGDIFFHISNTSVSEEDLVQGKKVSFEVINTSRGKAAANIILDD